MKLHRNRYVFGISLIVILLCGALSANATQTELWTINTFAEFQRGETEQVSLNSTGELTLPPQSEQLFALKDNDVLVWALAKDSAGNIYAGTGDQGKIFKITPDGKSSLFFDSPEVSILSLAIDAKDNVYAGSAPDGLIYKITPQGSPTTLFATGEHYVWSLAFDAKQMLYAGAGETGKIFAVTPDGKGTLVYDSPQTHVMALLYDPKGWIYAGTEGKGMIYKITPDGKVFALYNAEEEEIHSLALDGQGNLYLAALSHTLSPEGKAQNPAEQAAPPVQEKGAKKSNIYRLSPQGAVTKILELPDTLIYSMIVNAQDQLFVGTDKKGMLYQVFPDKEYRQVLAFKDANVVSLLEDAAGSLLVGTGDTGGVYRLSAQIAAQGTYTSPVHNVKPGATWGQIFWRGTAQRVILQTRTGNTPTPDDTWSPWSAEFRNNAGEPISNPAARFIQWKAALSSQAQENPVLEEISVAYLPNNLAPEIKKIAIFQLNQFPQNDQEAAPRRPQTPNLPVRRPQGEGVEQDNLPRPPTSLVPGQIAIAWDAADANKDELLYRLSIREVEDTNWNLIDEELEEPMYLLDATTLADGEYYLKITAEDSPNNPPANALTAEKISERFVIDTTTPHVSIALNQKQENKTMLLTVLVQDGSSRLREAEYALDGEEWISIFPDDVVTDSREEKYSISLSELSAGSHVLTFRATDAFGNVGTGRLRFSADAPAAQK